MFSYLWTHSINLITHPAIRVGVKILILAAILTVAAFLNTGVAMADPGWGGVGG